MTASYSGPSMGPNRAANDGAGGDIGSVNMLTACPVCGVAQVNLGTHLEGHEQAEELYDAMEMHPSDPSKPGKPTTIVDVPGRNSGTPGANNGNIDLSR